MKRLFFSFLLIGVLSLIKPSFSFSQCAMCRATVENNEVKKNEDKKIGNGLNKGILYLLSVPYLILATVGFFWYRQSKKEQGNRS
jgi:hypothetical protein